MEARGDRHPSLPITTYSIEAISKFALIAAYAPDTLTDSSRKQDFFDELTRQRKVHRAINVLTSFFTNEQREIRLGIFVHTEPATPEDENNPRQAQEASVVGGRATEESDANP